MLSGTHKLFRAPGAVALIIDPPQANYPSKGLKLRLAQWLGESIRWVQLACDPFHPNQLLLHLFSYKVIPDVHVLRSRMIHRVLSQGQGPSIVSEYGYWLRRARLREVNSQLTQQSRQPYRFLRGLRLRDILGLTAG